MNDPNSDPASTKFDGERDPPPGQQAPLSARDLQENRSQGELESEPGSDADQANEVPHVG